MGLSYLLNGSAAIDCLIVTYSFLDYLFKNSSVLHLFNLKMGVFLKLKLMLVYTIQHSMNPLEWSYIIKVPPIWKIVRIHSSIPNASGCSWMNMFDH